MKEAKARGEEPSGDEVGTPQPGGGSGWCPTGGLGTATLAPHPVLWVTTLCPSPGETLVFSLYQDHGSIRLRSVVFGVPLG